MSTPTIRTVSLAISDEYDRPENRLHSAVLASRLTFQGHLPELLHDAKLIQKTCYSLDCIAGRCLTFVQASLVFHIRARRFGVPKIPRGHHQPRILPHLSQPPKKHQTLSLS